MMLRIILFTLLGLSLSFGKLTPAQEIEQQQTAIQKEAANNVADLQARGYIIKLYIHKLNGLMQNAFILSKIYKDDNIYLNVVSKYMAFKKKASMLYDQDLTLLEDEELPIEVILFLVESIEEDINLIIGSHVENILDKHPNPWDKYDICKDFDPDTTVGDAWKKALKCE
nr:MAG TPA: hypothetical protein [Caudoviricetes sp.]